MAGKLLLLFIALPLVETWLLIEIGQEIGALATIGLVILTAIIGSQLVRRQGLQTLAEIQAHQRRGEAPAIPLLEGAALLLAGAFLVTPGFITDTLGFLLLVPAFRKQAARGILARAVVITPAGQWPGQENGPQRKKDNVIEGEYRHDD